MANRLTRRLPIDAPDRAGTALLRLRPNKPGMKRAPGAPCCPLRPPPAFGRRSAGRKPRSRPHRCSAALHCRAQLRNLADLTRSHRERLRGAIIVPAAARQIADQSPAERDRADRWWSCRRDRLRVRWPLGGCAPEKPVTTAAPSGRTSPLAWFCATAGWLCAGPGWSCATAGSGPAAPRTPRKRARGNCAWEAGHRGLPIIF